ncbi:MAG: HAD-IA family hydrolase [Alistipes sp.]|nr:HAD-IA family hydrolase [Alistipes sp.]MBQ5922011.1 HAD-IA family hydrolase [Alistipes sp.]
MQNRLFIFDLDGTLLNTIGDLATACDHMLALRNLPTHTYEEYCSFVGNGIMRLVERALPEELRTPDYVAAARRDFVDFYIEHIDHKTVPYEGMVELLCDLQRDGAHLAVASNKFQAGTEKLIRKFFPTIDFVEICGNREGVPLKPDTALVDMILGKAGIERQNCYMIGDSGVDMQTARNASIHGVGVSWGFRSREELEMHEPHAIADTVEELREILYR